MGPLGLLKVFSVSIRKLVFEKMEKSYIFYRNHQIYLYSDDRVETSEECTFLRLIANLKGYTILQGTENELIFLTKERLSNRRCQGPQPSPLSWVIYFL